jgi:hypothetical protein
MAALILALAGCSTSSVDQIRYPRSSTGPGAGAASVDEGAPQMSPAVSAKLPADFPTDVPLPAAPPEEVSAGRVPGGRRLWSLSYGDGNRVWGEERAALRGAGYVATLERDQGTGSYTKDATSVVTVVQKGRFVIMVTTQD